jgi:hypothetical protein
MTITYEPATPSGALSFARQFGPVYGPLCTHNSSGLIAMWAACKLMAMHNPRSRNFLLQAADDWAAQIGGRPQ